MKSGLAVGVISKLPRPGRTKTRLARTLGPEAALELHEAFVLDELDQLFRPDQWSLYVVHDQPRSAKDRRVLADLLAERATSLVPDRKGLAAELLGAFQLLLRYHDRAVIVSADVPQVDATRIEVAFAALDRADVVLGPGPDGGYWLVGLKQPHDLFTPIRMGGDRVTNATISLALGRGLRVAELDPLTDIDEAQDLLVLERTPPDLARHTRIVASGLERAEVAVRLPSELQIEATSRCNLACQACARTHDQLDEHADLSLEDFRRIIDPLPRLERVGFMLNGESMLNHQLPAMIQAATERHAWTVLNTNGTLLTSGRRADLLDAGLSELRVSLDGATRQTVQRMTSVDCLDRVLRGIAGMVRDREGRSRPLISVWMLACRSTIRELPDLVRLAGEVGVDEVYLQRLVVTGKGCATEQESLFGALDTEVVSAAVRAEATATRLGVALRASGRQRLLNSLTPAGESNPQLGCWRPWRSAVVTASMRVLPCCISSFVAPYDELEMGDLREQSWEQIWNGERYRALRRGILAGEPLEFCSGCGVRWSL
jgi:rSAM/selenodomain-associated transferase 1